MFWQAFKLGRAEHENVQLVYSVPCIPDANCEHASQKLYTATLHLISI